MNININFKNLAFTVIELIMVLAVLGILSSLAIPAYNNYTVRAKVADMINSVSALKITLAEYKMANGNFQKDENTKQILKRVGGEDPTSISKYITQLTLNINQNKIEIGLCGNSKELGLSKGENLNIYLIGEFIEPSGIDWTCNYDFSNKKGAQYVPTSCSNNYKPTNNKSTCSSSSGSSSSLNSNFVSNYNNSSTKLLKLSESTAAVLQDMAKNIKDSKSLEAIVKHENANLSVYKEALKNVKINAESLKEIVRKVKSSEDLEKAVKHINTNADVHKEILNHVKANASTLIEIAKKSVNPGHLEKVIKHKNSNSKVYKEVLNNLKTNSSTLKEIINKSIDKEDLEKAVKHVNSNAEVYKAALKNKNISKELKKYIHQKNLP